jgi:hypothetical protein
MEVRVRYLYRLRWDNTLCSFPTANSLQNRPSRGGDRLSVDEEIRHLLWNPNVIYLFIHGSTALYWDLAAFQFLNAIQSR